MVSSHSSHCAIQLSAQPLRPRGLRPLLAAGVLAALWSASALTMPAYAADTPQPRPVQSEAAPAAAPAEHSAPAATSEATAPKSDMTQTTASAAANTPVGNWLLEDIQGRGVIDRIRTDLNISADGRVSGSGGCNRFMSQAKIDGEKLTFGLAASTKMACPPAAMDQEARFLKLLEEVKSWRVDAATQKLFLLDDKGAPLLTFSATTPDE